MKRFLYTLNDERVTSLALGKFDGMHRAHQELFSYLDDGGVIVVIDAERGNLTPNAYKKDFAPYPILSLPLEDIKELSGDEFVRAIKVAFPRLKKIVVGYDFRFGKNRACGIDDLKGLFDGEVVVVPEVFYGGVSVHSEAIRAMLLRGDVLGAMRLLGRSYFIEGRIIRGQGIGARELFATINLSVEQFLIPHDGVYVTKSVISGVHFNSVSFIGRRLSSDGNFSIETHLLCVHGDEIPDSDVVRVEFVEWLRGNLHFENLTLLREQIALDIARAQEIHDINMA
ncbi:MAG: bifunctional riboflavin kinase/FAD synthetase [Wolinella sp.]